MGTTTTQLYFISKNKQFNFNSYILNTLNKNLVDSLKVTYPLLCIIYYIYDDPKEEFTKTK